MELAGLDSSQGGELPADDHDAADDTSEAEATDEGTELSALQSSTGSPRKPRNQRPDRGSGSGSSGAGSVSSTSRSLLGGPLDSLAEGNEDDAELLAAASAPG